VDAIRPQLAARLVVGWGRAHRDILLLMCACDALVVSSWQEASPTVVKEALACRLPVVSVPVGDVPERIGGVDGCEVCADDSAQTIAAALERVLARGERLSEGLAHELDEKVLVKRLIGFYREVLEQGSKRRSG
jgi:glycosyltransferase involved in cell wall biosynthesis